MKQRPEHLSLALTAWWRQKARVQLPGEADMWRYWRYSMELVQQNIGGAPSRRSPSTGPDRRVKPAA
jgi:hypothetical protein